MTTDTNQSNRSRRYIRKKEILADLQINGKTLNSWIAQGFFPSGRVLNPNSGREILAFDEAEYLEWRASRPARPCNRPEAMLEGRRAKATARQEAHEQAKDTSAEAAPSEPVRPLITRPTRSMPGTK
jgi:predicted DNA-binding transcriptional regulator AlpA